MGLKRFQMISGRCPGNVSDGLWKGSVGPGNVSHGPGNVSDGLGKVSHGLGKVSHSLEKV